MIRNSVQGLLFAALVAAVVNCASEAYAVPPGSPEISPSAAVSALAVLAGSGLMLAERLGFRRK